MEIIDKIDRKKISSIGKHFGLRFIILYGSAALGKLTPKSDIDIAFFPTGKLSSKQYFTLSAEISNAIKAGPKILDLVDLKTANPLLRYEIIRTGKLLFGDPKDYAEFKIFALKDYIDSQSLRKLERQLVINRQKALAGRL